MKFWKSLDVSDFFFLTTGLIYCPDRGGYQG